MKTHILIVFLCMTFVLTGCTKDIVEDVQALVSVDRVQRGKYLVDNLAACTMCHGENLAGGKVVGDRFGEVVASNITPAETGLKDWTPREVMQAIRTSTAKNGETFSVDVHEGYEWMSDIDTIAIVTYLTTIPPVENEVEVRTISSWQKNTVGFFMENPKTFSYVPQIPQKNPQAYGEYLVDNVARCGQCHNGPLDMFGNVEYLAGGAIPPVGSRTKPASALQNKSTGLKNWSEADIINFLKTGNTVSGRTISDEVCPTKYYKGASDSDLKAIATYFKSLNTN